MQTTIAPEDGTFALALPVPEGDIAHLATAMLVSAHRVLDSPGAGSSWVPLVGVYNPELELFSVALDSLLVEGSVIALIEPPDIDSIEATAVPSANLQKAFNVIFDIYCYDFADPGDCGPDDIQLHSQKLQDAYDKFVSLGYSDPALQKVIVPMYTTGNYPQFSFNLVGYLGNYIQPRKKCFPAVASYKPSGHIMSFCYDRERSTEGAIAQATTHELFHAFQHGYDKTRENWTVVDSRDSREEDRLAREAEMVWIIEGTASAAEGSSDRIIRADRSFHEIDVSLTAFDGAIEYDTQDFWVHFGVKKGLGLSYLKPLFERGATTEAAAEFFTQDQQTSLGAEYWDWAKNQVMDKTIDFDHKLLRPCHLEASVVAKPETLEYPPAESAIGVFEGRLDRLTSAIVRIEFRGATGPIKVSADETPNLRYKVYLDGEDAAGRRQARVRVGGRDAPRTFDRTPEQPVYVLLSNVLHRLEPCFATRFELSRLPAGNEAVTNRRTVSASRWRTVGARCPCCRSAQSF